MQSIFPSTKKKRKKEKVSTQGKKKSGKEIAIIAAVNNSFEMAKRYLRSRGTIFTRKFLREFDSLERRSSMKAWRRYSLPPAEVWLLRSSPLRGWHLEPRSRKIARRQGRYTVAIRRSSPCSYWEGFLLVAPGEMHVGCINGHRRKCLIVSWREPC